MHSCRLCNQVPIPDICRLLHMDHPSLTMLIRRRPGGLALPSRCTVSSIISPVYRDSQSFAASYLLLGTPSCGLSALSCGSSSTTRPPSPSGTLSPLSKNRPGRSFSSILLIGTLFAVLHLGTRAGKTVESFDLTRAALTLASLSSLTMIPVG